MVTLPPVQRLKGVVMVEGNNVLDLTELTLRLYAASRRYTVHTLPDRVVLGLQRLGCADAAVVETHGSQHRQMIRFTPSGLATPIDWNVGHPHDSDSRLSSLEDVGFLALADLRRVKDAKLYQAWKTGTKGAVVLSSWAGHNHDRVPKWIRPLIDEVLSCYRHLYGAVGLYWVLPLLVAMLGDTIGLWRGATPALRLDWLPTTVGDDCLGPPLCPARPVNCHVRCLRWDAGTWSKYAPLLRFIMEFMCQWLVPVADGRSEHLRDPGEGTPSITAGLEDLWLCTAGGVPLSVATVSKLPDHDVPGALYLGALCSVTDSGGGTLMLNRLRRSLATNELLLRVTTHARSRGFYVSHGFQTVAEWQRARNRPVTTDNPNELVLDKARPGKVTTARRGALLVDRPPPKRRDYYGVRHRLWRRCGASLGPLPWALHPPVVWMNLTDENP